MTLPYTHRCKKEFSQENRKKKKNNFHKRTGRKRRNNIQLGGKRRIK
jgi:hypothetical protein